MVTTDSIIDKDAALLDAIDAAATLDLHRSNLLRMQISELLQECQLDLDHVKWVASEAHEYLQQLAKTITNVSIHVKEYQDQADKPISLFLPKTASTYTNSGHNHTLSIEPIGYTRARIGYTKKAGNAQTLPTFDLKVQIPNEIFTGKDFMHYRYFDKRSIVMENVARALTKQSSTYGNVEYVWTKGMNRPPILRLQPPRKGNNAKFQVHLYFGMQSIEWIPKLRLVPNRCNIKKRGKEAQFYNHQLLFDARNTFEDAHIATLADHKSCQEALILVQVWALQRGLWRNHDGWDMNTVALLMVYLLRTHKMNPRMTSFQLFNVILQTWANTNWLGNNDNVAKHDQSRAAHSQATQLGKSKKCVREVLVLPLESGKRQENSGSKDLASMYAKLTRDSPISPEDPPTLLEAYSWTTCYELGPVFLDPTLTYNYIGCVSPNYMKLLQAHATKSLEVMKNSRSAFDYLFMQPSRFWFQWDMYIRVPVKASHRGIGWEFSVRHLLQILEIGLGNRINGIRILSSGNGDISGSPTDPDQYPKAGIDKKEKTRANCLRSPTGREDIVIGLSINPETSQRVVDRGPPASDDDEVKSFLELWGEKAQLRQFKDGAIVHAVVWNDAMEDMQFENNDKWGGGFVEKIARYLIQLHYTSKPLSVSLPTFLCAIDSVSCSQGPSQMSPDPWTAHQNIMKAYEGLSGFLRKSAEPSRPGQQEMAIPALPLMVDAIEPLSPCLRYSELFPPEPHPLLGGDSSSEKKVAGALTADPILLQLRFGPSSKWPTDLKAIGAAKTAMLIQLAEIVEKSGIRHFDGPITVSPTHLDLCYMGYCFRILVRADPEIRLLERLERPSAMATNLLNELRKIHILAARHHSIVHAVYTLHPSAAAVVRMAKRWIASHLLSGHISDDAVELMVAKLYTEEEATLRPPGTAMSGFVHFLNLLATHDWAREPLVVNPRGHISDDECDEIYQLFEKTRGQDNNKGPPMFIVAPYNKLETGLEATDNAEGQTTVTGTTSSWWPSVPSPEWVVLSRAIQLAKRSYQFLLACLTKFDDSDWMAIFQESSSSFKSYSLLLRIGPDYVVDTETSSTGGGSMTLARSSDGKMQSTFMRSLKLRSAGAKPLRQKMYRNLRADKHANTIICGWNPVCNLVETLRENFGDQAVFFYNALSPEIIAVLWRPGIFAPRAFSALTSEYSCPTGETMKADSLVMRNVGDLLREMSEVYQDIVVNVKIFDESCLAPFNKRRKLVEDQEE